MKIRARVSNEFCPMTPADFAVQKLVIERQRKLLETRAWALEILHQWLMERAPLDTQ